MPLLHRAVAIIVVLISPASVLAQINWGGEVHCNQAPCRLQLASVACADLANPDALQPPECILNWARAGDDQVQVRAFNLHREELQAWVPQEPKDILEVSGCGMLRPGNHGAKQSQVETIEFSACLSAEWHLTTQLSAKWTFAFETGFEQQFSAGVGLEGCAKYTLSEGRDITLVPQPGIITTAVSVKRKRSFRYVYDWTVQRQPNYSYEVDLECFESPTHLSNVTADLNSLLAWRLCGSGREFDLPKTETFERINYIDRLCDEDDLGGAGHSDSLQSLLDLFESVYGYPFSFCLRRDCGIKADPDLIWVSFEDEATARAAQQSNPLRYIALAPGEWYTTWYDHTPCDRPECRTYLSLLRALQESISGGTIKNPNDTTTGPVDQKDWIIIDLGTNP